MQIADTVRSSRNAWLEVDLSAIRRNVTAVRELVGNRVQVMAIVKADGYGHGAVRAARAALAGGASTLGVANTAEGAELRAAGIDSPILVLGCGLPEQMPEVVAHGLTQTLATESVARALSQAATAAGREAGVHIKIDTGMGRLGVRPHEALAFARLVSELRGLRIEGVFSHLATADHDDVTYAREQAARFKEVLADLERHEIHIPLRHLANSAATIRFPEMRLDVVRTGLLTYGLNPLSRPLTGIELTAALTWKTRIACIKDVPQGERLSYSGLYVTERPTRIACVPVGYADGYARALSNVAQVLVGGQRCRVVGAVCMDQMLLDIGSIAANPGDEVVLIGQQIGQRITANNLADTQGTVVHEVVARLGQRPPRVYLNEEPLPEAIR